MDTNTLFMMLAPFFTAGSVGYLAWKGERTAYLQAKGQYLTAKLEIKSLNEQLAREKAETKRLLREPHTPAAWKDYYEGLPPQPAEPTIPMPFILTSSGERVTYTFDDGSFGALFKENFRTLYKPILDSGEST